jgi:hypothetical protein
MKILACCFLFAAGCACDRYEVIQGPSQTILLDRASGKTWWGDFGHPPGENMETQHWREMVRTGPSTRPSGGV